MIVKKEYHTIEERNSIVNEFSHLFLIEEQNITEGNFLIFSDSPNMENSKVIYTNVPEEEFNQLKEDMKITQSVIDEILLGGMM